MTVAYGAVGSILAWPRQALVVVHFTVETIEAKRTGTPVPIDYILGIK